MKALKQFLFEASKYRTNLAYSAHEAHGKAATAHLKKLPNAHLLSKEANKLSSKLEREPFELQASENNPVFSHDKIQRALEKRYKL